MFSTGYYVRNFLKLFTHRCSMVFILLVVKQDFPPVK